jgi:hypothetical protein
MQSLLQALGITRTPKKRHRGSSLPILQLAPAQSVTPQLLQFLRNHHLLPAFTLRCQRSTIDGTICQKALELHQSDAYAGDRYELRCETHHDHISIRRGSFFESRRLPLTQQLYVFHLLASGASTSTITTFFQEAKLYRETVTSMLRELAMRMWSILQEKHRPVFTPRDEIEIDEMWMNWTKWEERVSPNARITDWKEGQWVIGIMDRARSKLWIECIPNRRRNTIQQIVDPMLKTWLLLKPRVHTDALKSYEYLAKENTHYVINKVKDGFAIKEKTFWGHSVNVNVNQIESTWMHLRKHLSMRYAYRCPQFAQLYIAEYMYNWYKLDWLDLIKY